MLVRKNKKTYQVAEARTGFCEIQAKNVFLGKFKSFLNLTFIIVRIRLLNIHIGRSLASKKRKLLKVFLHVGW